MTCSSDPVNESNVSNEVSLPKSENVLPRCLFWESLMLLTTKKHLVLVFVKGFTTYLKIQAYSKAIHQVHCALISPWWLVVV